MKLSRRRLATVSGAALASGALWRRFGRDNASSPTVEPAPGVGAATDHDGDALERAVEGNVEFGLALLDRLADANPDENLLVSPASVGFALGMTDAGARGETAEEIAEALRFPDDREALRSAHQQLQYELNERADAATDGEFELAVANGVWGLEGYPYRESYLETLEDRYGAELRTADFGGDPEGAREKINGWVAERTNERIDELFPDGSFDDQTRLVLANAVYLLADWHHQFEESDTREEEFTLLDGETAEVPLMRQTETFPYAEVDGHRVVELPYVGEEIGMLVVLPPEDEFEQFEDEIDAESLATLAEALEEREGEVVLPRFEFDAGFGLTDVLAELGIERAFDPDRANFDGMVPLEEIDGNLFVGDVRHEAFVAVDEEGTEAAAATGVEMEADSAPAVDFRMVVDRPFLFLIRDRETDATLFLGRVVDPR
ncbi:serine protease inhibitor family protein [Natronococcus amylolyticus DSM 10524]|uniref:Serine protease inhibitor family protein n=1 Tax=Natronococcus amylolyticus DSM 10524 TaxID=1227497 RepID=L9XFH3_9EURY|nr:serpin family protein [Natronococcus amylolyticus]ELY60151.1 serine protease inhibitor family protein [Natronococcus amylolyticus DSM 10524]